MRRILVTAVSGDIGNAIVKILLNTDSVVFACDINEYVPCMNEVEEFWQCSYAVEKGYIDELLAKCQKYDIQYLIPTNEREIEAIDKNREYFERIGIKIVIQNTKVLQICLDKYKTMEFLKANSIGVPDSFIDENMMESDKQYICKARRSNGSKKNCKISGRQKELFHKEEDIIQEFIDSDEEYTIGVFRDNKTINTIIFRRQLKNGYSNLVKLQSDSEIEKLAKQVADIFDLRGYINIQLKRKAGNLFVFEINPRISGTVMFRHMLGFEDLLWWLDLLDGKSTPEYFCQYKDVVGIRELSEKILIQK